MTEWQPIETAPKDGTLFLAVATKDGCRMKIVGFSERGSNLRDGQWGYALHYFSHWMPLPEPPADL